MTHSAQITSIADAAAFVLGGNATFTLVSLKTGKRYTYKAKAPWDGSKFEVDSPRRFVQLLTGPDTYDYIGFFYENRLNAGKKGNAAHPAYKALNWFMQLATHVATSGEPAVEAQSQVQFWHEGHCARCGRQLTVPASIERGFGPDCAAKIGLI